ncbi:uncharacterized protein LOC113294079 [Papaver somniferum]|uniref:uncharacterized protein LOC113294079 n=1 Tax=Papaver somniferum TaxID=3469 RepID=UPI000E6FDC90|nr:uncharacterized protein LOC113294079 [Papaver somniferum]
MGSSVTTEDLKAFHSMDRELFKRLVVNSRRDLVIYMQAIAFWIYLEEIGYPNIVQKLLRLNDVVVNNILDEAIYCLCCLQSVTPLVPVVYISDLPFTHEVMGEEAKGLSAVCRDRISALTRINQTVNQAFSRAFTDIMEQVVGRNSAQ